MDSRKRIFKGLIPALLLAPVGQANAEILLDPFYTITTGSWPEAVAVADLNGDGRKDVALITSYYFDPVNDYKLKIFLQDEFGQLQPSVDYALTADYVKRPKSLAVGDLNNDLRPDLVVGMDRGYIQIFSQQSDGTLAVMDTITTTLSTRVAVGDLNGDGLDDIAGIAWGGPDVAIFYQTATGINHTPELHAAAHGGYDDMELGDVNGDDRDDIVVMSGQGYAYDNLAVITSDGTGGLNPVVYYDLGGNELTKSVAIGDLNGDGRGDVAVTFGGNRPNSKIAVFHQQPDGTLGTPSISSSYDIPEAALAEDLNHDGRDDLLVAHGGWMRLGVFEQDAALSLLPEQLFNLPYASSYNPQGMAVGDISGDGIFDVVIADYNYGLVVLNGQIAAPPAPPVADAGPDQVVRQASLVTLSAAGSSDSDGVIVNVAWAQVSGPAVELSVNPDGTAGFAAPVLGVGESAVLVFELTVTDDDGLSASDTVAVTVLENSAPVADAGVDQSVTSRTLVSLDGTGSFDPDGQIAKYQWTQVSGQAVELTGADGAIPTFVAPRVRRNESATLVFELEVTDELGLTSTDSVVITVSR